MRNDCRNRTYAGQKSKDTLSMGKDHGRRRLFKGAGAWSFYPSCGDVVVFMPPLSSTIDEIEEMTEMMGGAIREVTEGKDFSGGGGGHF